MVRPRGDFGSEESEPVIRTVNAFAEEKRYDAGPEEVSNLF